MSGRGIPPPMAMRGRHVDERGQFSGEVMRFLHALRQAIGGDAATVTQVVVTRSTEAPVPMSGVVPMLPPVAVSADTAAHAAPVAVNMAPDAIAPVAVNMTADAIAPVAVSLCVPETIPIPLM
jgi:hypothetical protein